MTFDIKLIQSKLDDSIIKVIDHRVHSKASEEYIDVIFSYPKEKASWNGSVPVRYRRTGIYAETNDDVVTILKATYIQMHPRTLVQWNKDQNRFWDGSNKKITRPLFEAVRKSFEWTCVVQALPGNTNWARRWQDIKEAGYTTATHTKMYCEVCKKNTTHVLLLPIPRAQETGYETISPKLKQRILSVLNYKDAYEAKRGGKNLIPDHKFPEIRWDNNTRTENQEDMSDQDIKEKFQLLNNQRNLQKREVCRSCYQTGKRGKPFDVDFYYVGNENWPSGVPRIGKKAEEGCVGCGWYDLEKWRSELNKKQSGKK